MVSCMKKFDKTGKKHVVSNNRGKSKLYKKNEDGIWLKICNSCNEWLIADKDFYCHYQSYNKIYYTYPHANCIPCDKKRSRVYRYNKNPILKPTDLLYKEAIGALYAIREVCRNNGEFADVEKLAEDVLDYHNQDFLDKLFNK